MKSTRTPHPFRSVSAAVLPGSRTITRTISASLSGFRRSPQQGCEAKLFSAVRAQHDSVGHLFESRCATATIEVFEAVRHRASRSIQEADVIEREVLAGFSAPFNSLWSVHGKLRNSHSLLYRQFGRFGGKSTGVLPGPGLCHEAGHIQPFPTAHAELSKGRLRRSERCYIAFPSDCQPRQSHGHFSRQSSWTS